jgi:hypothetical protein
LLVCVHVNAVEVPVASFFEDEDFSPLADSLIVSSVCPPSVVAVFTVEQNPRTICPDVVVSVADAVPLNACPVVTLPRGDPVSTLDRLIAVNRYVRDPERRTTMLYVPTDGESRS